MRGKGRQRAASAEAQVDILGPKTCTRCASSNVITPHMVSAETRRRNGVVAVSLWSVGGRVERRRAIGTMNLRWICAARAAVGCNAECLDVGMSDGTPHRSRTGSRGLTR